MPGSGMRSAANQRHSRPDIIICITVKQIIPTLWLIAVVVARTGSAQVAGAWVAGTVVDESGGRIGGARVALVERATGRWRMVTSGREGVYAAANLNPGVYGIRVEARGFATVEREVRLRTGDQVTLDFRLRVGERSESVEVTARTGSATQTASGNVAGEVIRGLPLNGRDWTQLALLAPGVAPVRTMVAPSLRGIYGSGQQLTVSGARPQGNNYRLNAISVSDPANGAPGSVLGVDLGVDAISEFSILTSTWPAEYGRAYGGVINAVTRAGTSSFHGAVREYLRNDAVDARNFFDAGKPPFRRNQYGVDAGGAAVRNRLFLFGDFEGIRQSLSTTQVSTVPSAAAREGRLAAETVTVSERVKPYLAFYPLPNGALLGNGDTGRYSFPSQAATGQDYATGRADYHSSDRDAVYGVWLHDRSQTTQPDEFANKRSGFLTRQTMAMAEWTHTGGPKWVNALRAGFSRHVNTQGQGLEALRALAADTTLGVSEGRDAPQIEVPGLTRFTGGLHGLNDYRLNWNSYQLYDDVFVNSGSHLIKAGVAVERMQDNIYLAPQFNGRYTFGSLKGFLANQPLTFIGLGGLPPTRDLRQTLAAVYVQDDVRVKPNLTLNLGLRYEFTTIPTEAHGRIALLRNPWSTRLTPGAMMERNPTARNFEPRVGFAWDPLRDGKTVVRSGFGIYDVLPLPYNFHILLANSAPYSPFGALTSLPAGAFPRGGYTTLAATPAGISGSLCGRGSAALVRDAVEFSD